MRTSAVAVLAVISLAGPGGGAPIAQAHRVAGVARHPSPRRCRTKRRHPRRCRHARPHGSQPRPSARPVSPARTGVDEGEYYVSPTHPSLPAGTVEFDPVNLGMDEHNLTVRDAAGRVLAAVVVQPGQTQTLSLKLAAGTYTLFCSLYDHERLGMHSTLIVR